MTQIVSQQASANIDLIASELEESAVSLATEAIAIARKENKRLLITENEITETLESEDEGTMTLGVSFVVFYALRYRTDYAALGLKVENEELVLA